jgi:geranylgeranyl pyrophosphate synthase
MCRGTLIFTDVAPAQQTDCLRYQACEFISSEILPIIHWEEFEAAIRYWIRSRDKLLVQSNYSDVLPSLSYVALGGDPQRSLPLTAAWMLYIFGARVLDDAQDQDRFDRPWSTGKTRCPISLGVTSLSAAQMCLAKLETDLATFRDIVTRLAHTTALAARSQSLSLSPTISSQSLEEYFRHVIATTAEIFAVGAWAGGRLCQGEAKTLQALHQFGFALGMKTAIILDCRDLNPKSPDKLSDLTLGNWTLPILYAVATLKEHAHYDRLLKLLQDKRLFGEHLDEVIALVEDMGALTWCVQIALDYEKKAHFALDLLPNATRQVLTAYV